jgi:hypothetical protein
MVQNQRTAMKFGDIKEDSIEKGYVLAESSDPNIFFIKKTTSEK